MRLYRFGLLSLLLLCSVQADAGSIAPTDDTFVERDMPANNNGGASVLIVGDPSGGAQYEAYLRFGDIAALPSLSDLESLVLWMRIESGSGTPIAYRAVDLGAWDEGTLSWENAGEFWDGSPGYEGHKVGEWYSFDVEEIVDDYGLDELTSSGVAIISSSSDLLAFYSKDSSVFPPWTPPTRAKSQRSFRSSWTAASTARREEAQAPSMV